MDDTTATLSTEVLQYVSPKLTVKETEKSLNPLDWAKDSGDKFYSLTGESDLISSEHNLSESRQQYILRDGKHIIKQRAYSAAAVATSQVHKSTIWP
ncbi:hypothetical protein NDU88_003420 [Pleurodeles waltl]|uniref:Uncharacterized protein n=1 Tax=Pleurodeles waltl TaxID=8319 RepID=A0AAV7Q8Z2_PLEWA|nr:hypothetical protein NDU88_003420 [Pleurodeles waltl]